jgi:hypothetical protein
MRIILTPNKARKMRLTTLTWVLLALAGMVQAQPNYAHKAKGRVKITAATEIGGTIVQPGKYDVREVNTAEGTELVFSHSVMDPFVQETVWPYEDVVVARARADEQSLNTASKKTHLEIAPQSAEAVALEIRGKNVEYVLSPSALEPTSVPSAMAGSAAGDPNQ